MDAAINMFQHCNEYYENPFETSASLEELRNLWNEILMQENIIINFELISFKQQIAVVEYDLTYTNIKDKKTHVSSGIYIIEFHKHGYCKSFKQWFMVKN